MTDPTEHRIADLETRLAHQEHAVDELSAVVAEQARAIDRLTLGVRTLTERLRDMAADQRHGSSDDKPPPHY